MRCKNVIMKGASVHGDGGYFVDISCHDHARFDRQSDEEVWRLWDDLAAQAGHLSNSDFEALDKASGFNYHSNGLLGDEDLPAILKPCAMTYDSMHNLWSNGTVGWEMFAFVQACKRKAGVTFADFRAYARRWQFQRKVKNNMFTAAHETACKNSFKGGASELISIFHVVLAFAEERVVGTASLDREVAPLRACGLLVDAFMKVKRGMATLRNDVIAAAEVHLNLHTQAYGTQFVKPKHHYVFHNAEQDFLFPFPFPLKQKTYFLYEK